MIEKTLIVYKKSAFEIYRRRSRGLVLKRLRDKDEGIQRLEASHEAHGRALDDVIRCLAARSIRCDKIARGRSFDERLYDLIIAVGGDGTFLDAAGQIKKRLLWGVNSDPAHSVGKFCASTAADFEVHLDRLLGGRQHLRRLWRMRVHINGKVLPRPVLNDVLVCHECPASISHYILRVARRSERQRSSGIWVSTASGASGAIHAVGGLKQDPDCRRLQYAPRELCEGGRYHYRLRGGITAAGVLEVESQMQEAVAYFDGAHCLERLDYGSVIGFAGGQDPLKTVHFPGAGHRG